MELAFEEAEALCDPLNGVFLMSQSVRLLAYEVADAPEDPESELAAQVGLDPKALVATVCDWWSGQRWRSPMRREGAP